LRDIISNDRVRGPGNGGEPDEQRGPYHPLQHRRRRDWSHPRWIHFVANNRIPVGVDFLRHWLSGTGASRFRKDFLGFGVVAFDYNRGVRRLLGGDRDVSFSSRQSSLRQRAKAVRIRRSTPGQEDRRNLRHLATAPPRFVWSALL